MSHFNVAAAKILFPGFGFFAHTDAFLLKIDVSAKVLQVCISIQAPHQEILNLGEILFYDKNGYRMEKSDIIHSATLTSIFGETTPAQVQDRVVAGSQVHTDLEDRPTLTITFTKPVFLGHITLANRADKLRKRSKYLVCETWTKGKLQTSFSNQDSARLLVLFGRACALANLPEQRIAVREDIVPTVQKIEAKLMAAFDAGCPDWSFRDLAQFLPLFTERPAVRHFHIQAAAVILVKLFHSKRPPKTAHLRVLEQVLRSSLVMGAVRARATDLHRRWTGEDVDIVLAKHSIHKSGLVRNREAYLNAITKAVSYFDSLGYPLMLCYGSLLGAVRDNAIIPHDDDIDLLYIDGSKTRQEAEANKAKIIADCRAAGRGVTDTGENFHINFQGCNLDFFFCWEHDGKIELMMEKYQYRTIDRDILLPPSKVSFYDRRFPAPNDPRAFLFERYGAGWTQSDPYFDFPWDIQRFNTLGSKRVQSALARRKTSDRKSYSRSCIIAQSHHTNDSALAPPANNLPAIAQAISLGCNAVKIDLRLSADDIPVLAKTYAFSGPDGPVAVPQTPFADLKNVPLGNWNGAPVGVVALSDVLAMLQDTDTDVLIDPHMKPDQLHLLGAAVDRAGFDRGRMLFCVSNFARARKLIALFPESVLLWEISHPLHEVGETDLDEAASLGLDGVMLRWPVYDQDLEPLSTMLAERSLRVLYDMTPHTQDHSQFLPKIIASGAHYILSTVPDMELVRSATLP